MVEGVVVVVMVVVVAAVAVVRAESDRRTNANYSTSRQSNHCKYHYNLV